MDLEKIQKQIDKCKDEAEKKSLHSSMHSLENKLRRLEWSIRESDLTQMYNAGREKWIGCATKSIHIPLLLPRKIRTDYREDAENKEDEEKHGSRLHEYESRNYLVKTLLDARAVLRNEPSLFVEACAQAFSK